MKAKTKNSKAINGPAGQSERSPAETEALQWAIAFCRGFAGSMRDEHFATIHWVEHFREDWKREFPEAADKAIKDLIGLALFEGDEGAIKFLCFLVSDFINRDEPLNDDLKAFTTVYLKWHLLYPGTVFQVKDGKLFTVPRKSKKRGRRSDAAHDIRNNVIRIVMDGIATGWEFPPTRNDGSERASAASIVKEALETEKILFLEEKSINKIWEGRDRDASYDHLTIDPSEHARELEARLKSEK